MLSIVTPVLAARVLAFARRLKDRRFMAIATQVRIRWRRPKCDGLSAVAFAARDSSSPLFDAILSCPFALSVESVAGAEGILASLAGGSATLVAFDDIFDDARIDDARVDDALLVSILRFLPQPCLLTWGTHSGRFRRTHREHGNVFSHFTLAAWQLVHAVSRCLVSSNFASQHARSVPLLPLAPVSSFICASEV